MQNDADTIKAGLKMVMTLLIFLMVVSALKLLSGLASGGGLISIVWFALTAWICWNVYIGKVWARILLAGYMLATGIIPLVLSLGAAGIGAGDSGFAVMGFVSLIQVVLALSLFVVPSVNAYFEYAGAQSQ
jgi:hypothetical protein